MKTVYRTDRASLRSPTVTPQGFLRVDGHVGKVGIYEYRVDGKLQRELRPREEVGSPEALASFADASVTVDHPLEQEVTADNVRRHEVGSVSGAARMDGDHVAASMVVKDAKAIKLVKAGKQELSPGYKIALDETPGEDRRYATPSNPTGRYDAVQRNIRVNHLAIVDRARGGSSVRLRMDAAEISGDWRADVALDAAARHAMSEADFAIPGREGLPIRDEGHVKDAMARFGAEEFKSPDEKRVAYSRIVRRAKALGTDAKGFVAKWSMRLDSIALVTTLVDGHQHKVETECHGPLDSGHTSWAAATGTSQIMSMGHSHGWVREADGRITILADGGHSHGILDGNA